MKIGQQLVNYHDYENFIVNLNRNPFFMRNVINWITDIIRIRLLGTDMIYFSVFKLFPRTFSGGRTTLQTEVFRKQPQTV